MLNNITANVKKLLVNINASIDLGTEYISARPVCNKMGQHQHQHQHKHQEHHQQKTSQLNCCQTLNEICRVSMSYWIGWMYIAHSAHTDTHNDWAAGCILHRFGLYYFDYQFFILWFHLIVYLNLGPHIVSIACIL